VLALGSEMLVLGGAAATAGDARAALAKRLADGSALAALRANIERQGGDPRVIDRPGRLGRAPALVELRAERAGYLVDVDPLALGLAVRDLGGGRRQPGDAIDPLVGVELVAPCGARVDREQTLARVHARDADQGRAAAAALGPAFTVGDAPPPPRRLIADRME
jgi:thymidine phosphorylase